MQRYNEKDSLGVIKIHKNTISSITYLAALETEGVKTIGIRKIPFIPENLMKKLTFIPFLSRIKVEIHKDGEISVSIPIIIKYGFNLTEVGHQVQTNVYNALDKMTGIPIKEVNINIQGVEKEV